MFRIADARDHPYYNQLVVGVASRGCERPSRGRQMTYAQPAAVVWRPTIMDLAIAANRSYLRDTGFHGHPDGSKTAKEPTMHQPRCTSLWSLLGVLTCVSIVFTASLVLYGGDSRREVPQRISHSPHLPKPPTELSVAAPLPAPPEDLREEDVSFAEKSPTVESGRAATEPVQSAGTAEAFAPPRKIDTQVIAASAVEDAMPHESGPNLTASSEAPGEATVERPVAPAVVSTRRPSRGGSARASGGRSHFQTVIAARMASPSAGNRGQHSGSNFGSVTGDKADSESDANPTAEASASNGAGGNAGAGYKAPTDDRKSR